MELVISFQIIYINIVKPSFLGKSSLFRRFMANTFVNSSDRKSTLGLDHFIKTFNVNDRDMSICLASTIYAFILA